MNKHLQAMKTAVEDYRAAVKKAHGLIAENDRLYKPEEAERANAAVLDKLKKDRDAALEAIWAAQDAGRSEAESWGQLDGSKITDDAKLLDAGAVNAEQFKSLVRKYQGNATMLTLLGKYAEKQNGGNGGFNAVWGYGGKGNAARSAEHFDTTGLPTIAGKKAVFDRWAKTAIDLTERIGNREPGKMGMGPDSPIVTTALEKFAADVDI